VIDAIAGPWRIGGVRAAEALRCGVAGSPATFWRALVAVI
jgi:hypothetical protein